MDVQKVNNNQISLVKMVNTGKPQKPRQKVLDEETFTEVGHPRFKLFIFLIKLKCEKEVPR